MVAAMLKRSDRNLIVGLDIGTSKVVALVAELVDADRPTPTAEERP